MTPDEILQWLRSKVQRMRENGEGDLRSVLHQIDQARKELTTPGTLKALDDDEDDDE